jgi:hypothetical protein
VRAVTVGLLRATQWRKEPCFLRGRTAASLGFHEFFHNTPLRFPRVSWGLAGADFLEGPFSRKLGPFLGRVFSEGVFLGGGKESLAGNRSGAVAERRGRWHFRRSFSQFPRSWVLCQEVFVSESRVLHVSVSRLSSLRCRLVKLGRFGGLNTESRRARRLRRERHKGHGAQKG